MLQIQVFTLVMMSKLHWFLSLKCKCWDRTSWFLQEITMSIEFVEGRYPETGWSVDYGLDGSSTKMLILEVEVIVVGVKTLSICQ